MREREGLIARIRQIRRVSATAVKPAPSAATGPSSTAATTAASDAGQLEALEARVAHLERLVEGLQDSVHRESERQGRLIADLQAQIQPGAISAALSKDARERGL